MTKLEQRFISLWQRHAFVDSDDVAKDIFKQLIELYTEPWRGYHNLDHIKASLGYFDACQSAASFADAMEMAIWYHDCVYVLGARDNEARSRDWFLDKTNGFIVPAIRSAVDQLIMDTCHLEVPLSEDGKLIADIDLTSFCLEWDDYMRDSLAVQSEFEPQSEDQQQKAKIQFFDNLLKDGQVYYSQYYLAHFEEKAQQTVKKHRAILVEK